MSWVPNLAYKIAYTKQTVPLLFRRSRPSIPLSRPLGCTLPQPKAKRSLFNFRIQNYCLMPEPVGVPVIVAALTVSAPSFVLFHSVSSGLLWVTCKVRK
jgi:hypothetical protein